MTLRPAPGTWAFDPIAILFLLALLGAYLAAVGPLRPRYQPDGRIGRKRIAMFVAGWLILALSVITPLDTLGRYYLFSAHTLQLFFIITAVAPLLMLGLPDSLARLLLPTRRLREVGRDPLFSVVAVLLFNLLILVWHAGPIYEAALHNTGLHDLQLLTFLVAGLLTWWPLLTPADAHIRLSSPMQILYLAAESLPLDVFGIFTLFAKGILYTTYATAPRILFDAATDQQLAGGILFVPGNLLDIIVMSIVFFGWVGQVERTQRERERAMYDAEDAAQATETPAADPASPSPAD
ncbi:MAG: cytochrome c oxidase assembly protein [Chloroflexota bacterium]|nr:cytochrome c oxidase assembly protein [Chloroflexota bacterium]